MRQRDGGVDVLVNNAGIFAFGPTAQTTEEAFDATYDINVKVPYFLVRRLVPLWHRVAGAPS